MIKPKCDLCKGTGDGANAGAPGMPCPKCGGSGGWPRAEWPTPTGEPWPSMTPPARPLGTGKDAERWEAEFAAMPEVKFLKWQRNFLIATTLFFAFWALFNYALFRRLLDEITKLHQ